MVLDTSEATEGMHRVPTSPYFDFGKQPPARRRLILGVIMSHISRVVYRIPRIRVNSSHLHSVGYDAESLTLEVALCTGTIYHYYEVTQETYDALMSATSHGKYFVQHIQKSHIYRRIV